MNTDDHQPRTDMKPPGSLRTVHVTVTMGSLQFVVMLLGLARSKLFALLLGPLGVGIVSTLDQLVQFIVQASSFGLTMAPARVVPRVSDQGSGAIGRVYRALLLALIVAASAVTSVLIIAAILDSSLLVTGSGISREAVAIAVAGTPLAALTLFFTSMLSVTLGHRAAMVYVIVAAATSLVLSYGGAWIGGIPGLYVGSLVAGMLTSVAAAWRLAGFWSASGVDSPSDSIWVELRRHENLGAFLGTIYILSFAQPLAFLLVRSVLVSTRGAVEAGHFQAVFAISGVFSMLLTQTGRLYFEPQVNRESAPRARAILTHEYVRVMAGLMIVGALPMALFPELAVTLLFSREFLSAAPYLFLFVLADCLFLSSWVYLATLRAQDDLRWSFGVSFGGSVLLALAAWALVPRWGLAGAGVAFVFARAVTLLVAAMRTSAHSRATIPVGLILPLVYLAGALCATGVVVHQTTSGTAQGVAARVAGLVVLLAAAAPFLRGEERSWLRSAALRAVSRLRGKRGAGS